MWEFCRMVFLIATSAVHLQPNSRKENTVKTVIRYIALVLCIFANATYALDQTETGFFYPIGKDDYAPGAGWLAKDPDYFTGEYHIGVDMMQEYGRDVYAIADGKVVYISYDKPGDGDGKKWGVNNCALVIEHKTYDERVFTAVYGHVQCKTIPTLKSDVYAGKSIGKIGHWDYGDHLHFGIHEGLFSTMAKSGWGKMPSTSWTTPCIGKCLNTFTDPIAFIQTHFAYNPHTERQTACIGDICWEPKTAFCETAISRYRIINPPYAKQEGVGVCSELKTNLTYITSAPNPQERIPEDHGWRKWWRAVINSLGKIASAEEIQSFVTMNTINVYTGTVVHGNATLAIHGAGAGYGTEKDSASSPDLPDFVTTKSWLETPWGIETYRYGWNETIKMKGKFENIGDDRCLSIERSDIVLHAYLSKGYKEDPHSGDRSWKRVAEDTIPCSRLRPGDTHTDMESLVIRNYISSPGIYNIVWCADHPQNDHNNGGGHREKHESNNCSTEAVFEVTADPYVNVMDVDFIVSAIQPKGSTQLPAGGTTKLKMAVRNIGSATPISDIRSSYFFCGPLPSTNCVRITDDESLAGQLTPGRDQWEETVSPITIPSIFGDYLLMGCADSLDAVHESDETNNCTTTQVTVIPPRPDFIISGLGLREGTNIKSGTRVHPFCAVSNIGTTSSPRDIRIAYYINQGEYRDHDSITAYKLCAGCSVWNEVKNNDIKLGDKGTRTYRCCADYQGVVNETDETNNCATMSFIVR